ncbi:MAG TPA: septum formation initiator [Bacteroidales bacterium]|nr:MAG: septum formation initiator [Bacteroidetes bacterium GWF2_33_38]OFY75532.1 MAG: septum formation initiator [Bacteroidetes bacterium RIFOXYA12_FULL_33_9]OFY88835.1 MAG: septum formation initiator [Bacteroidetes bacterium RIFOXYA2_FULL_33_7]HBF89405.1 septum formation initiator [Bacteroidales bacterium]
MKKFKKIVKAIFPYIKNKYILTTLIFLVWLLFLDNNNLVDRYGYIEEYNQLVRDQEYYLKKIETDSKRMEELRTNKENLEKFAREQYLMKRENEDIFIFVEED